MTTPLHEGAKADWTAYAPLDAGPLQQLRAAAADVAEGFQRHRSWRYLAFEQVRNSYRRTVLGPWWLTAQAAVYVVGLALVFGQLLNQDAKEFLPYVAVGFLCYAFLSGLVRSGANLFVGQADSLKSTRQPLTSLVLRQVMVEAIQFGHNVVILVAFFAVGLIHPSLWLLLAPVGFAVMVLNGVLVGLWLGPLVARFRDLSPAIESVLQVLVFFTPIFYHASDLRGAQGALVGWNPFTYLIDFFRVAVLGGRPSFATCAGELVFSLVNLVLATVVFARCRSRIPYWVS